MSQTSSTFRRWISLGAFGIIFSLLILFCFQDAVFNKHLNFYPPVDGSPFFVPDYQARAFSNLWGRWGYQSLGQGRGGSSVVPVRLLAILLPPAVFHPLRYILDTLLLALATAFFLRGRGFRGISQWLPAVGMAFSGYTFTLISAGHAGYFDMIPFAVFLFGCLDRGIRRRSLLWFGWAGVCAAFGLATQPDVMVLFGVMAAVYSVFLFFEYRPKDGTGAAWLRYTGMMFAGGIVAMILLAMVAASAFAFAQRAIETREKVRGKSPQEQWEFATNWSMPPEELLELAVPFVYGIETGDRNGPYWGRLGRSMRWDESRQGLMNLKQHTLYMGLIPLLLGLYALAWSVRKARGPAEENVDVCRSSAGMRREIWFWSGALVVTVVLAMGRYTPVYRLFYALPFFDRIRAPVKFIHLSEFALAVLFAYGLTLLFVHAVSAGNDAASGRMRRLLKRNAHAWRLSGFAIGAIVLAIVFALLAQVLPVLSSIRANWDDLGFGGFAPILARWMRTGLLRASGLALVMALVFFLPLCLHRYRLPVMTVILWLAVAVDMATVGKPYVRTGDVRPLYSPNPVAERILQDEALARTAFFIGQPTWRNWVYGNLMAHGVDVLQLQLSDTAPPLEYQRFFGALQNYPLRLWEMTNTRYLLGERAQFAQLLEHPAFREVMGFHLTAGRYVPGDRSSAYVLLQFAGALPRAMLYYDWIALEPDEALQKLADPQWNPRRQALVSSEISLPAQGAVAESAAAGSARILRYGRTRIDIETDAPKPGLLVLKDKYDPDWRVTVNGVRAELLRCNYIMRGVMVPAGKSTIRFTYRPNLPFFVLSLSGVLMMLVWSALLSLGFRFGRTPGRARGEI